MNISYFVTILILYEYIVFCPDINIIIENLTDFKDRCYQNSSVVLVRSGDHT